MVIPEFVPTPDNLAFTGAVARLDRAIYGLITERRRCVRVCGLGSPSLGWVWWGLGLAMLPSWRSRAPTRPPWYPSRPCSELAAAPRPPSDLLDALLLSADEAGQGMGDQALRDELLTLLVAGACADTTKVACNPGHGTAAPPDALALLKPHQQPLRHPITCRPGDVRHPAGLDLRLPGSQPCGSRGGGRRGGGAAGRPAGGARAAAGRRAAPAVCGGLRA